MFSVNGLKSICASCFAAVKIRFFAVSIPILSEEAFVMQNRTACRFCSRLVPSRSHPSHLFRVPIVLLMFAPLANSSDAMSKTTMITSPCCTAPLKSFERFTALAISLSQPRESSNPGTSQTITPFDPRSTE